MTKLLTVLCWSGFIAVAAACSRTTSRQSPASVSSSAGGAELVGEAASLTPLGLQPVLSAVGNLTQAIDLFAIDGNGRLNWDLSSTTQPWTGFGGIDADVTPIVEVSAVGDVRRDLDLYALDANGVVKFRRSWNGAPWSPFAVVAGDSSPVSVRGLSVIGDPESGLDIYAINSANQLVFKRSFNSAPWSAFAVLDTMPILAVAALGNPQVAIDLYAIGLDHQLYWKRSHNGAPYAPFALVDPSDTHQIQALSVQGDPQTAIAIAAIGLDNLVYLKESLHSSAWTPFAPIDAKQVRSLSLLGDPTTGLDVYAVAFDNTVQWTRSMNSSPWSGFGSLSSSFQAYNPVLPTPVPTPPPTPSPTPFPNGQVFDMATFVHSSAQAVADSYGNYGHYWSGTSDSGIDYAMKSNVSALPEIWRWDAVGLYLLQEPNSGKMGDMSTMGGGMLYANRMTKVGDTVVSSAPLIQGRSNVLPSPCAKTGPASGPAYLHQRTTVLSHEWVTFGGDLGTQETVILQTVHDVTNPTGNGYAERFWFVAGKGLQRWQAMNAGDPTPAADVGGPWNRNPSQAPDGRWICFNQ